MLAEILSGLNANPKQISSKYFYDDAGDKLFQEIMKLEEYYLPNAELNALQRHGKAIAESVSSKAVEVVELGAGDGQKTIVLLEALLSEGLEVTYVPMDISSEVLETNQKRVSDRFPDLKIKPIAGDYFQTLNALNASSALSADTTTVRLMLFLGSNLGNYANEDACSFLTLLKSKMRQQDQLLIGLDLKKRPSTILAAYNDSKGVTRAFNLNLLHRLNRELKANFNVEAFEHYPFYHPIEGIAYSYLVSLEDQVVQIGDTAIYFEKNELIQTEVSQKYSLPGIERLQKKAGFGKVKHYLDGRAYYTISLMQP